MTSQEITEAGAASPPATAADTRQADPAGAKPRVRELQPVDAGRWDAFVHAHPDATFFHLSGWKTVIERVLGHRTFFLCAEVDGEIRGVLPLARVKSLIFGDALISAAFYVYGGIAAADERARQALAGAACELAQGLGVDYLELRHRRRAFADWPTKDLYVTFRKELDPDPEKNMLAIPRKQRAMVRKGIKAGLRSEIDDGVERFYPIFSESYRNLGTPVHSRRWFRTIREVFGEACEVLTVSGNEGPLSTVMSFYFRDEVLPYYGGGTPESRTVAAHDFMYWELMRRACERGVKLFDFGRSKRDVGSYRFKKHWGFEPEPLHYEFHLVRAAEVPDVNPLNPRYRLFIETWKRLPLWASRIVGPRLARGLG